MKIILGSMKYHYAARVNIFLVAVALVVGMVGYGGDCEYVPPPYNPPPSQNLKIRTWYDLAAVRVNLAGNHTLMNDLDSTTAGYDELASPTANQGKGWKPIKFTYYTETYLFKGSFYGQGYEIRDIFINRPNESTVGLFGTVAGHIENIGVVNITVTGDHAVGGLVGWMEGTVSNSYSTGNVIGKGYGVGGLVGDFTDGIVSNSYSTCNVTGYVYVGGLMGEGSWATVRNSYSTGSVTGTAEWPYTGPVGGLVGYGVYPFFVKNSFWDKQTSGQIYSDGGIGKNTMEMQDITTFSGAGWNITAVALNETNSAYIWNIVNNVTYPFLSWQSVKIRDWYDLDAIRNDLDRSYVLMNNLNSTTPGYTELAGPTANCGKGWQPIGNFTGGNFTGSFDGKGYEIRDLFINRPDETAVGLFSTVDEGGVIRNVRVVNADVTGEFCVGALVGFDFEGAVSNCYATGSVTGELNGVGSLVGISGGTVSNCYSSGNVTGNHIVGGLVGAICGPEMAAKYGLPNACGNGTVSKSYSTCSVSGNSFIGGLLGLNGGPVSNSYSTFSVTGNSSVGGLVGENCGGTVSNSYATGNVTGNSSVGGLVGHDDGGTVTNSFWDIQTSGQNSSAGGTGKNTTEMQDITTFSGATWNITTVGGIGERNTGYIWNIVNSFTYPFLSWQP
jgi:hypothetical protein